MPRPIAAARLVELMAEDARLQAKIKEIEKERNEKRAVVVAELERRKVTELTALGNVITLKQQHRRSPSVAAAKQRLEDRPELLARLLTEVVDGNELKELEKHKLLTPEDIAFIAPLAPHGGPFPVMALAAKAPRRTT